MNKQLIAKLLAKLSGTTRSAAEIEEMGDEAINTLLGMALVKVDKYEASGDTGTPAPEKTYFIAAEVVEFMPDGRGRMQKSEVVADRHPLVWASEFEMRGRLSGKRIKAMVTFFSEIPRDLYLSIKAAEEAEIAREMGAREAVSAAKPLGANGTAG